MEFIDELKELQEMSRALNLRIDRLIARAEAEGIFAGREPGRVREVVYPLTEQTKIFRGKKPTAVLFADGRRVDVLTWKQVAEVILKDCNKKHHADLMELRGRIGGRNRLILSSNEEGMRSPRIIDRELYFETHYDVENMMRILVTRVLQLVGYNYRGISLVVLDEQ